MTTASGAKTLREWVDKAPPPYDRSRVAREIEDLEASAAAPLLGNKEVRHLLASIHGNSPYLTRILDRKSVV